MYSLQKISWSTIKKVCVRFITFEMQMKYRILILTFLLLGCSGLSQSGGNASFSFLNLDYGARNTALGGSQITVYDDDLNLGLLNPAALNKDMHQTATFNHGIIPSGINQGQFGYAHHNDNIGTFGFYTKYVSYGRFQRTDETGQELGNFTAGDFIIGTGLGRRLNERLSVGANVNLNMSFYEQYNAFGMSVDLSGMYYNEEKNLTLTAMVRNAGFQFKSYSKSNREIMPINAMLGVSYKFHYAPFRLSVISSNWQQWDLTYNIPGQYEPYLDPLLGDTIVPERPGFGEKLFRHFIFNTEILISEHLHLRVGFNYLRRQELKIAERPGLSGFSGGVGFHVMKIRFDYGLAFYSAVGMQHQINFSTRLSEWTKKSKDSADPSIFREGG